MEDTYILKEKEIIPCFDTIEWGKWMETANRRVARETFGDSEISTIFLGLDHSHLGGKPILFETLVFGGDLSDEMDRYSTWDEAVLGHKAMVDRVKNEI